MRKGQPDDMKDIQDNEKQLGKEQTQSLRKFTKSNQQNKNGSRRVGLWQRFS